MTNPVVTVFGGTGFIGRYVVRALVKDGWRIRVAVRRPDDGFFLRPLGGVGQIELLQANLRDERSVARCITGSEAVVNAVGILHESGHQTFRSVQTAGPLFIGRASRQCGVARVVHISAIGARIGSESTYAHSKGEGEAALQGEFPTATIIRPSIVFGPEDDFFNRFAAMARISPFLPVIGDGRSRFQPVYVHDVAAAIARTLQDKHSAEKTFELGGPRIYSFRELMQLVLEITGRRRLLLTVPLSLAKTMAPFMAMLPNPPLTPDQLRLLQWDNVVGDGMPGLAELGISPVDAEAVLPSYLHRFRHAHAQHERHPA